MSESICNLKEYRAGTLAYIDSLHGLVPCKVIEVKKYKQDYFPFCTEVNIHVIVTAARPGYFKGEHIILWHDDTIIPRASVYRSRQHCGQYRVRNNYTWVE